MSTKLHDAAARGDLKLVRRLVEKGNVDVDSRDGGGRTPLHHAALCGQLETAKWLVLNGGADINARDVRGDTPLASPVILGKLDVVVFLVETCKPNINVMNRQGEAPLHLAARSRHTKIVHYLVTVGKADVNAHAEGQATPLYYAAYSGDLALVKFLVDVGKADVNVGDTPLHAAARKGHLAMTKYLVVSCAADTNAINKQGQRPLHEAATGGHLEIIEYLISTDADVDAKDNAGWTPLHQAAEEGHLDIVKYLVEEAKADVHIQNGTMDHSWILGRHLFLTRDSSIANGKTAYYLTDVQSVKVYLMLAGRSTGTRRRSLSTRNKLQRRNRSSSDDTGEDTTDDEDPAPTLFLSYAWGDTRDKDIQKLGHMLAPARVIHDSQAEKHHTTQWKQWMHASLDNADRILVVCSAEYERRSIDARTGVGYEVALMEKHQELFDKAVIVFLGEYNPKHVPTVFYQHDAAANVMKRGGPGIAKLRAKCGML